MSNNALKAAIAKHEAEWADLRFTDMRGISQHITIPVSEVDDEFCENGKMFDGSSIKGWQKIHQSDLALLPVLDSALPDPFFQDKTIIVRCNVVDPLTNIGYDRDPRSIAQRAEAWLQSTGIADEAFFGPELEFFLFDDVRWDIQMQGCSYSLDSEEAQWNSGKIYPGGNIGHRPSVKGGYFPVPPIDSSQDIRSAICSNLKKLGIKVEAHHHEVATGNQNELQIKYNRLTPKADESQLTKYVIQNTAHAYGKSATFMPKPLVGDNGSGMHVHQSLMKDGVNLFSGDLYAGLSETALYYIGGIIHHAKALNAFTNPTTVSYKRLVPGFEAPVLLAYSARNRSASIRIPHVSDPKKRRIEVRFPDPMANPYLAFSAMMMAGLDGIARKIHPGDPMDKDLYDLPPEELVDVPKVARSLEEALEYLREDKEFLTQGNVFSPDFIDSYIAIREEEIQMVRSCVHPIEFQLYYSL